MVKVRLTVEGNSLVQEAHPIFGEDIKDVFERESEQIFRREKIEGTFKFVGADFDFIESCSLSTRFIMYIERDGQMVQSASFYKTDCTMNYDDRLATIKLKATDIYEKLLADYDNKYNLVRLAPKTEAVDVEIRGVLQFYVRARDMGGDKKITNIVGGMSYEQDATQVDSDSDLRDKYKFSSICPMAYFDVKQEQIIDHRYDNFVGRYFVKGSYIGFEALFEHESNGYRIAVANDPTPGSGAMLVDPNGYTVATASVDSTEEGSQWLFRKYESGEMIDLFYVSYHTDGVLYARYLCPSNEYDEEIVDRPIEDICDYDLKYPYVRPTGVGDIIQRLAMIPDKSVEPTPWGIDSSTPPLYYKEPTLTDEQKRDGRKAIPIGQSFWLRMSTWVIMDTDLRNVTDNFNKSVTLKDNYPLVDCIKVLLAKVAPNIYFNDSDSAFLNRVTRSADEVIGTYPFPCGRNNDLYITPITNVKKTLYDQAAQKGDISLKQILDMLRKVFRCYWWIENYHLKIEHITYFKHGGTYSDVAPNPTIDVTNVFSPKSGKPWSFGTNEVSYDVDKVPSRYEFKWGDESTEQFNGIPIDFKDRYLENGKKESISVENFVTDMDFAMITPNEVGDDLYMLLEANRSLRNVPIVDVRLNSESPIYRMQNGLLSFLYAEKEYYRYDMAGWIADANGNELLVDGVSPIKRQKLSFPCTLEQARNIGYIKTGIGVGDIDKMTMNIDTLLAQTEVLFEQGQDYTERLLVDYRTHDAVIINPTDVDLDVTYAIVSDADGSMISINHKTAYAQNRAYISTDERIKILNAKDIHPFSVDRIAVNPLGGMTIEKVYSSSSADYSIVIKGNSFAGRDWAMLRITSKGELHITIQASSEENYDWGWADHNPKGYSASSAEHRASGTSSTSFYLMDGDSIYLGYTKDVATVRNEDKVTFNIKEL